MIAVNIEPISRPKVNLALAHNKSVEMETSIRMCFPRNSNELRSVRSCTCKQGRFKVFWAEWTARIGEDIVFSRIEVWVLVFIRRTGHDRGMKRVK